MVFIPGKPVTHEDRQAILAAIGGPGQGEVEQHLRKGERDHDEEDARGADRKRPDHRRQQARQHHRHRPDNQHLVAARKAEKQRLSRKRVMGKNTGDIAPDAEIGRMAERHHAAQPQREIQPDPGQRQDGNARGESDIERLVDKVCHRRHRKERDQQQRVQRPFPASFNHGRGTVPWGAAPELAP
jgi:hypothetical protein